MTPRPQIILASNSPRRKELLQRLGLRFTVDPADVDEGTVLGETPQEAVLRLSRAKARVVAARTRSGVVVAADTIVVLDGAILGKPADAVDAMSMLANLSGREHLVVTGMTVVEAGSAKEISRVAETRVWIRNLGREEITAYVATGEPLDKAGAYGIQGIGGLLVSRIDGCYYNVVGFPLSLLSDMLAEFGVCLLSEC